MSKHRKIIYLAGFLFSIPLALTSYVNSSFLETYVGKYYVGIIYIIASIIAIIGLTKIPSILKKFGNRNTTLFFSSTSLISLIALAFSKNELIIISSIIIYFISSDFIIASLDIFIEDFSKNSNIGKLRGLYLMIINFSWVVAQAISGSIIQKSSYQGIYLFSAFFMILVSFIFIIFLRDFKDPNYIKVSILKTIKHFIKNKNLSRIYFIYLILKLFFAWMVIYTPIYLHEYMNFSWGEIGIIFTIMLLPFVILDYPLGKLSDKIGEKKLLIIGFIITIVSTLFIPFINYSILILFAIVLFLTRVGAATIEVMSESYFFKEVNERDADVISFFRNTYPLAYIIGPLLAMPMLIFLPSFKYLFIILAVIMLVGLLITLQLKDKK